MQSRAGLLISACERSAACHSLGLMLVALAPVALLCADSQAATIGAEVGTWIRVGHSEATESNGGVGFSSISAELDGGEPFGFARGRARFVGPDSLPHLQGIADALATSQANASSTAYRLYTYSGPASTVQLDVALAGSIEASDAGEALIEGTVGLILGVDLPHATWPPTLFEEIVPEDPDLVLCGNLVDLSFTMGTGIQTAYDSIACEVENGDRFFLWSNLFVRGARDGLALADDGLTMAWADSSGVTAVPESRAAVLVSIILVLSWINPLARVILPWRPWKPACGQKTRKSLSPSSPGERVPFR